MSEQFAQEDIIPNGEEIVERFGGIRPMASKLNVPVTTVQGWKKRDAIPAIRRDEILSAAALHNINLKGLITDAANQNTHGRSAGIAEDPALAQSPAQPQQQPKARVQAPASAAHKGDADMLQIRRMARNTSLITTVSLLVIVLGAGYLLFGQSGQSPQNIDALENRLAIVEQQANTMPAPSEPGFVGRKLAELEQKVGDMELIMGLTPTELATMARNVATGSGASLAQRLSSLEQQLTASAGGAPALTGMVDRMQTMSQSPQGRVQMQKAIEELRSVVTGLQGRTDTLESTLTQAKTENAALAQTLQDVTGRDLGAAAMLLALTQLRQAADREAPFTEDLALLQSVAEKTDPQLAESVSKLAPFAEQGILSPAGLKRELLAATNEIVSAKMRGEDVSVKDKVMGRIKGLFSVSKDGVPMAGGSPEQALIKEASAQLDAGNVAGAMAALQKLEGPAAEAAAPWQNKAAATVIAQQLDLQLVNNLMGKIKSGLNGVTAGAARPINLAPQAQPQTQQPDPLAVTPQPSMLPAPEQPSMGFPQ
ncbi:MAG: hypothetical protein EBQ96_07645 [Proteobacteria bacterium]|nr:hypothetical protein [Pseudomonadota bacterium]